MHTSFCSASYVDMASLDGALNMKTRLSLDVGHGVDGMKSR